LILLYDILQTVKELALICKLLFSFPGFFLEECERFLFCGGQGHRDRSL